ncbi:CsbD family protein [Pseudobacteriovorax antillogorgiicola]|uniref:Uncharacterized conserved protein YjbJ, UPF0337 family n=1 Tax=Pseudobacteriovorax antillogorgiicola TaxID=1513793 RepID=A0A1Y6CQ50_9BACT|nr:CsbD family protein [Pseudobacteriovorax antillogorgiicola]TCS47006.1 uncharacterized protein YjbJ (UPF0337 family) [Pseudobacteriovorax antillogorgiicola]SMF65003.1 Uncharacterized conserved protein YjbJ, UPF0337 family [Pseudobacteriovorax antillogorgiicola]
MNGDIFEGKWEQAKGKIRQKWGKLTDDDMQRIQGKSQELKGCLQERYGYSKEEAEQEIDKFSKNFQ